MDKTGKIKKAVFTVLAVLILGLLFAGCSSPKILTEDNNGAGMELNLDDTVEIKLESNPTTGYSWFLSEETTGSAVSVTGPQYMEPEKEKDVVGEGGYEIFTITAVSRGKAEIILNYERPWEEEEEPIEIFKVTVLVK